MKTFLLTRPSLRWPVLILTQMLILGGIGYAFWLSDWRYSLPTPIPEGWAAPEIGQVLPGAEAFAADVPVLLHFFNPQCPCSRFNLDHVREIIRDFGSEIRVVLVIENATEFPSESIASSGVSVVFDTDGGIARKYGVYATPQAVVLAPGGMLVFRGNYNRSRFCIDPQSAFVRNCLTALLAKSPMPDFPKVATTAWGCPIPQVRSVFDE